MKRFGAFLGLAALCWSSLSVAIRAQGAGEEDAMQPLLVVSLKSFEELTTDLDFIGGAGSDAGLGGIEGVLDLIGGGQLTETIDQTKPWGLAISSDGLEFQILGFLPIKDLSGFLEAVAGVAGGATELEDDIWQINLQGFALCLKQQGDWTYASLSPDFLGNLPEDPTKLLASIDTKHDVAAAVHMQNIPEVFRQLLFEQIKGMAMQSLEQLPSGEGASSDLQRALIDRQFTAMTLMANDIEVVRFGGSIDREGKKSVVDLDIVAVEGSPLAAKMAETAAARSKFSGFVMDESLTSLNLRMMMTHQQIEEGKAMIEELRAQVVSQLEGIQLLDDQGVKERVIDLMNRFIDLGLVAPVNSGALDLGLALAGTGPYTLIAGVTNPESENLQKLLEEFANMLETEAGFYGFQLDVAKHQDVRFHSASIPLPGGEIGDQLTEIFGFDLELTFGVGPHSAYLAIGGGGVDKLKAAIDASLAAENTTTPPVQMNLKVASLLKLLSGGADADPNLTMMAQQVEAGKDKLTVVGDPIERGMHLHIEGEESLLKALPTLISTIGLPAGLPF